jgi:hypothetical protein
MPASPRSQSLLRALPGAVLALTVVTVGAYALWNHDERVSVIDGRFAAELDKPTLDGVRSSEWMASTDAYMDERVPARESLLAAYAAITTKGFQSPVLHNLYVDGPHGQLLEKPPVLTTRTTLGEEAAALADSVGQAKVLWVYAPRKEEIYAAALPQAWDNPYPTLHEEIVAAYEPAGEVLDLTDLVAERAQSGSAYFRTDHHWTPDTAKAAADAIADTLAADGVVVGTDERAYAMQDATKPFFGSTGRIATLGATTADAIVAPVPEGGFTATMCVDDECGLPTFNDKRLHKGPLYDNRYRAFIGGNHGMAVITNESPHAKGRVVLLTDSFGTSVATYLAERVAQLVVIDERRYEGPALDALTAYLEPDAVVVLHNPMTLLMPSFEPDVWTQRSPAQAPSAEETTYETKVYENAAVVTEEGLVLLRNYDQPLENSLGDDAEALAAAIDDTGVAQVWVYAPRKEEVYPELVPQEFGNPVAAKRDRLLNLLEQGHEVIDLTPALADPALRDEYFYRTDHHWTPAGAQLAVDAIADELARQGVVLPHDSRVWRRVEGPFPFIGSDSLELPAGAQVVSEPMWYLEPDGGFRAVMCADACDEPGLKTEWISNPDPTANRYYAFLGGGFQTIHLHNDSPHASGTIVMLKDSYSHAAALALAERVTDLYLVDERGFTGQSVADFVAEVDADAVVVMHNPVSLLSRAFNRDVWRNAGD